MYKEVGQWNEVRVPGAQMPDGDFQMVSYNVIQLQQDFLSHCRLFLGQNVDVAKPVHSIPPPASLFFGASDVLLYLCLPSVSPD